MKEHLASLGLALAALALFWLLLFPKPERPQSAVPQPVSSEAGAAGYLGLTRWLESEHVPLMVWRGRYTRLDAPGVLPTGTGNVLITTMPHALPVRAAERPSLERWVRHGNTLVVMAALADTPPWSLIADRTFQAQLRQVAQLDFEAFDTKPVAKLLAPSHVALQPLPTAAGPHPLLGGVGSIATVSELPASRWRAIPVDDAPVLALARRVDNGDEAVWLRALGRGVIVVSAYASPFSNEAIGAGDNARWFATVIAQRLGPGGRVLLDDAHQGIVDYYDSHAFFADPRLHASLGWIVLAWLVFVLGARRLAPAGVGVVRVDDAAMLKVSAGFYTHALSPAATAARLLEHFFNSLRRRLQLREDGAPVWDWLERQARVPGAELAELRRLHERAAAGRAIDLLRLQTLLSSLSGHLT